ncbi:MAG TPA: phosphoribosylamine--glycine ligase [Bacteroidales bacterium]|jgi:phosphoribosylamine--glycine ligase|nr:phosphoribosylamine--glycine ligase [Bacteroidales bacterium]
MNILILGSGGREHALAWKLAQSTKIKRVFVAPGNAGTASECSNLNVDPEDFEGLRKAVITNNIGMVVVGPEAPLVGGVHDFFLQDDVLRDVPVIGPVRKAALLEGSKDFAKEFLTRHSIPTAAYRSFDRTNLQEAMPFLMTLESPYVIKADGLAAGKGVVILSDINEAFAEVKSIIDGKFGSAGAKVIIEQYLKGIELSVFIITDGRSYKLLPEAKDYKRIGQGDTGLNTGGMGAVSPVPFADGMFMNKVVSRIIDPTLKGLRDESIDYKGFIFFGLMNVDGDPYVIEYNARLGDPETEAIIPRIKSDLFELLEGVVIGDLDSRELVIDERSAAAVMLVSGGYPGHYEKGYEISGLDKTSGCVLFHSGTKISDGSVVTSGGRVVAVSSLGNTMKDALASSYKNAAMIEFKDIYYRNDIGFDL